MRFGSSDPWRQSRKGKKAGDANPTATMTGAPLSSFLYLLWHKVIPEQVLMTKLNS